MVQSQCSVDIRSSCPRMKSGIWSTNTGFLVNIWFTVENIMVYHVCSNVNSINKSKINIKARVMILQQNYFCLEHDSIAYFQVWFNTIMFLFTLLLIFLSICSRLATLILSILPCFSVFNQYDSNFKSNLCSIVFN